MLPLALYLNCIIGVRARDYRVCVRLFSLIIKREFPNTGNDSPAAFTLCASPTIPMKNTSLLFLLGNAKRKPSADPTECKRARFRALGGSQVIGLKALIPWYNLSVMRSAKQKTDNFFQRGKKCSFSHFQWSNTQARQRAKRGKGYFGWLILSFPNGRCSRHLRPPCPIYEN